MPSFIVCHRGALGDFLLTWPALTALRAMLRGHRFIGVGHPSYLRLAKFYGLLDTVLDMEAAAMSAFFAGRSLPPTLEQPDGGVLWLADGEGAAALLRAQASLPVVLLPPVPSPPLHVSVSHWLALRAHFSICAPPAVPDYPTKTRQRDVTLIHPGSGSPRKNFSPPFYRRAAEELQQREGGRVMIILGPVERERGMEQDSPGCQLVAPPNLEALVGVLSGASLYIGNDAGASHLAGLMGIPTVAIYKSTDPAVWGVLGRYVAHVSASTEVAALAGIRACLSSGQICKVLDGAPPDVVCGQQLRQAVPWCLQHAEKEEQS